MDIKEMGQYLTDKGYKIKISRANCLQIINKDGNIIATGKSAQKRLETLFDYYQKKDNDSKDKKNMMKDNI